MMTPSNLKGFYFILNIFLFLFCLFVCFFEFWVTD